MWVSHGEVVSLGSTEKRAQGSRMFLANFLQLGEEEVRMKAGVACLAGSEHAHSQSLILQVLALCTIFGPQKSPSLGVFPGNNCGACVTLRMLPGPVHRLVLSHLGRYESTHPV